MMKMTVAALTTSLLAASLRGSESPRGSLLTTSRDATVMVASNKGNSGGALLNTVGQAIAIVSMREGGISRGLQELTVHITETSKQGGVALMGVDPLQAMRAIIQTLDTHISTGIGYARSSRFLQ